MHTRQGEIECSKARVAISCINGWGVRVLTEQEVARSWARLFKAENLCSETIAKAEALLDELRPESPLRHRFGNELDELRELIPQN